MWRAGLFLGASLVLWAHPDQGQAEIRRIAVGLDRPVVVTAPVGDSQRIFIAQQRGKILLLNLADNSINATPFLTISGLATGNEQGLLGLAFHPDYATNGLFYVNYTETGGDTVIAEYGVSGNPDVAIARETRLLTIDQPQINHNGGWIGFGPGDGDLYIATGDGEGVTTSTRGTPRDWETDRTSATTCWARSCASTSTWTISRPIPTATTGFPQRIPSSESRATTRSGVTACAIPIARASIARPGISTSETSDKALVKRSMSFRGGRAGSILGRSGRSGQVVAKPVRVCIGSRSR